MSIERASQSVMARWSGSVRTEWWRTVGTGMLYSILVGPRSRRAGIGERLLFHIKGDLASAGARMIVAEIPGDPVVMRFRALLLTHGFSEEARIEDYYADGLHQIVSVFDM